MRSNVFEWGFEWSEHFMIDTNTHGHPTNHTTADELDLTGDLDSM